MKLGIIEDNLVSCDFSTVRVPGQIAPISQKMLYLCPSLN